MSSVFKGDTPPGFSRRQALGQVARLLGLSLSVTALNALAGGYQPQAGRPNRTGHVFDGVQMIAAAALVEVILPETETPGAAALDVHGFMDYYLHHCESEDVQAGIRRLLSALDEAAADHKAFALLDADQQRHLVVALEAGSAPFSVAEAVFFSTFKKLTVFGYYTSEVGANEALAYLPIPGGYDGDFTFPAIGKAWSLN